MSLSREDLNEIQKNLVDYMVNHYTIEFNIRGWCIDGKSIGNSIEQFYPPQEKYFDIGIGKMLLLDKSQKKSFNQEVRSLLTRKLSIVESNSTSIQKSEVNISSLVPLIDPTTGEIKYYSRALKRVTSFSEAAMRKVFINPNIYSSWVSENAVICSIEYNPRLPGGVREDTSFDSDNSYILNACYQPRYRSEPLEDQADLDENFLRYLTWLFPKAKHLKYVINWVHTAVYYRNDTYLVLNGKKGCGKGLFCRSLSRLVGIDNYDEVNRSFLSKEFNKILRNKRVIILDEIEWNNMNAHNKLKSYANRFQAIEGKGTNASKEEMHFSAVISNNGVHECLLFEDDRRFSVPDLVEDKLKNLFSSREISKLWDYVETDPGFPGAFAKWLEKNHSPGFDHTEPLIKSKTFKNIVEASRTDWQSELLSMLHSKEKPRYEISDLKARLDGAPCARKRNTFDDFLKNVEYEYGLIAHTEIDRDIRRVVIIPHEKLRPEGHNAENI